MTKKISEVAENLIAILKSGINDFASVNFRVNEVHGDTGRFELVGFFRPNDSETEPKLAFDTMFRRECELNEEPRVCIQITCFTQGEVVSDVYFERLTSSLFLSTKKRQVNLGATDTAKQEDLNAHYKPIKQAFKAYLKAIIKETVAAHKTEIAKGNQLAGISVAFDSVDSEIIEVKNMRSDFFLSKDKQVKATVSPTQSSVPNQCNINIKNIELTPDKVKLLYDLLS